MFKVWAWFGKLTASANIHLLFFKPTKLQREEVIGWFDDEAKFKYMHNQKIETEKIEEWQEPGRFSKTVGL